MEFFDKKYEIFKMFNRQWGLATAGNIQDFDGCTISWGSLGDLWGEIDNGRYIVTIYIHPDRYTHKYLQSNDYFSVSFFDKNYKSDLGILGTESKRDGDKFALTSLTPVEKSNTVIFEEANLTFICKKIYYEQFNVKNIAPDVLVNIYTGGKEPHFQYIGEIVDVIDKR
ncbi:flavin reductase-like protein [Peptostreptococcaceae bacterium AS15]|nr:flavin reductase-like protein [Peptostreptococcaceae bacterium AS15]